MTLENLNFILYLQTLKEEDMFDNELSMEAFGEDIFNGNPFEGLENNNNDFNLDGNNESSEGENNEDNINQTAEGDNSEEVGSEDQNGGGFENDDEGESSSNFFTTLTGFIHEKGLLPSIDLGSVKIETEEDFVEAIRNEIKVQSELQSRDYLQNLNLEAIAKSNYEIQNLETVSEDSLRSNLEQAKSLIFKDYINQGLSEERATRLLNRLVDLGEDALIEDALTSVDSLKQFESRRIEEEQQAYNQRQADEIRQYEETQELIKKSVFERNDLFKDYKAPQSVRKAVYETMNNIVGKDPNTGEFENRFMRDRRESPIDFDTRMYYVYTLTDGFKDFSKLTQTGKSIAVKDLEQAYKSVTTHDSGKPAWTTDNQSYDVLGIGDELIY